jgi:putative membrane protein
VWGGAPPKEWLMSWMSIVVSVLAYAFLAGVAAQSVPGVKVRDGRAALGVAVVFGLMNAFFGYFIVGFLGAITFPLAILMPLTRYVLVPVVANAVLLKVADGLLDGFELKGWLGPLLMGGLFGFGGWVLHLVGVVA